ncbi:MAG: 2-oxoacid:acceptor oxidoreductase subunit alpha, partial [Bacteroidota bacterium]
ERVETFGRYLDVDGDGIPYRTIPGTHPTKGSFFTRGTSRDEYARYTEDGAAYVRNVNRLLRKWETAKDLVPAPQVYQQHQTSSYGMLFFGTTAYAAEEAMDLLTADGIQIDAIRVRAFPFNQTVADFIASHSQVFVIEQNRDAQMRSLLINELEIAPDKLIRILNYDGMPITANTIKTQIIDALPGNSIPQHSENHVKV